MGRKWLESGRERFEHQNRERVDASDDAHAAVEPREGLTRSDGGASAKGNGGQGRKRHLWQL